MRARVLALVAAVCLWSGTASGDAGMVGFDGGVTPDGFGLVVEPTYLYLGTTSPGLPLQDTFTVTNTESLQSITINSLYRPSAQCAAFTLTPLVPRTMAPLQADTWTVTFTASTPGYYSCHVEFNDTDSNEDFIDLYAEVTAPMMSVSPTSLMFGTVPTGDTEYRAFYITNNGSSDLTITSLVASGSTEFEVMDPGTPFTVSAHGGIATIYVTYAPIDAGLDTGMVVVNGDDPNNPSDTVTWSGTGDDSGTGNYLDVTPDPLDFLDVDVGSSGDQDVTLSARNTGTITVTNLAITGPAASTFTIEAHGCTGTQSCDVSLSVGPVIADPVGTTIRCTPTSPYTKVATLTVTSDAANSPTSSTLTCNGVGPDIRVSPTSLAFGTVRLGQDATLPVRVENAGNATLTYSLMVSGVTEYAAMPACGTGCLLGPGEYQDHAIVFSPTAIGPRNASLIVMSDDPMEMVSSVSLTGSGGGGVLTLVQPAGGTLAFGTIPVDTTSATRSIQVRNDGNMNLKISSIEVSSTTAFDVAGVTPPPDLILAPTQSHTLTASCTPPAVADYTSTVTIGSDAPINPQRQVMMSCAGIDSDLVAMPAPIGFDPTRVGDTDTVGVTITNSSGSTVSLQSLTASPGVFTILNAPSLPLSLAAGADTSLDVRFTPTADGDLPGTLTIGQSSGDPLVVNLLGPGRVASFAVSPDSHDFGMVCAGSSVVKRFSVTSTGSADFQIEQPGLVDPDVVFELAMINPSEGDYPWTVTPSGTVTVDVTASPTTASADGTLELRTDVDDGDVDVALAIIGISDGVGIGPATVDFGPVAVDGVSTPEEVGLANCDAEPLLVTALSLTGADAAAFAIGGTLPPPDLTVPVAGTQRWTVVFRPTRAGAHSANLLITHAQGTGTIPLFGMGDVGDPDAGPGGSVDAGTDPGFDTTSYYACWCRAGGGARPEAAAPIVLAFVLVLRRRRRR